MVDKHVVKMILESAQLLSTAHRVLDGQPAIIIKNNKKKKVYTIQDQRDYIIYQPTHINHPSAIWTRTSIENYNWLVEHFFALCAEYTHRYGKVHKTFEKGYLLQSPPMNLREYNMTEMPRCMPDEYKDSNSVINSYRNYYKYGKKDLHKYTKREPPYWLND
jgi:hypothetical protein